MQSDRELLELAAKAAGVEYDADHAKRREAKGTFFGLWLKIKCEPYEGHLRYWNPLTDDGDALRLAAKLGICIEFGDCLDDSPVVYCGLAVDRRDWPMTSMSPDFLAATRRAITRAAAQLAQAQEGK